jgi:IS5 family transposase
MDSFSIWVLRGLNAKQSKSRLLQISDLIDWLPIRHELDEMYDNKSEKGGRPNYDVILMFKILILQHWYGLSDLEIERQMADRISFMAFLGFPDPIPDSRTIWLFKERMAKTETDKIVWAELQRQLDAKGLQVRRGTIQDATFIELRQIPDRPKNHEVLMLRPVAVEMVLGLRKAMNSISVTSFIKKMISTTA